MFRARDMVGTTVHLPHRLDRGTSGALVLALDEDTHRALSAAFRHREVDKSYLALVRGRAPAGGTIDHPIRPPDWTEAMAAVTEFTLVGHSLVERCSLVCVEPRTGRAHQIRRHLKHINHPLIGDTRYGDGRVNRHYRDQHALHRLALHARRIAFRHPVTGLPVEIEAPVPRDLGDLLSACGFDGKRGYGPS